MAKAKNGQVDIEDRPGEDTMVDAAAEAVRGLLAGRTSLASARMALELLNQQERDLVGVMTRLPKAKLEMIRNS